MIRSKATNEGVASRSVLAQIKAKHKLGCAICGLKTTYISIRKNGLVVSSPLRSFGVTVPAKKIAEFELQIKNNDLVNLHKFLVGQKYDGLDFYCPDCDKIYCENHYILKPVWDFADFYDYTEGECPDKHRRILDD